MTETKKLKCYYAHFMGIYDTPQEIRDIATLEDLGLEVFNPNIPEVQAECKKANWGSSDAEYNTMFANIFFPKIRACEVFAFKALPDGRIPGGVFMELKEAQRAGKLIIELPSGMFARGMGKEDTREYLKDIGQR